MSAEPQSQIGRHGDWLYDIPTGEVIGRADRDETWHVQSRDDVEWVLSLMAEAQSEVVALERRREALLNNISSMVADHNRRLVWLERRFKGELEQWARDQLAGQDRTRTVKTPHGRLSFRKTQGSTMILDPDAAVAWAEKACPEAVSVKRWVLLGRIPDALKEHLPPEVFVRIEPQDRFSIDTGVEK